MDKKLANDSKITKGINLYLTMDGIEASGCSSSDLSASTSVNVRNRYLKIFVASLSRLKKYNTIIKETTS